MKKWLRRGWRTLVAAMAVVGFIITAATATPLAAWWARHLAGPWNDPRGETLIVLAGSAVEDGIIGASSYWRSVYAVRAWREGGFQQVVVSGGNRGEPAALAMRRFLVSEGVPADRIRVETMSHSTRENAVNLARMLAGEHNRKVLLTSDYHMFRAHRAFTRAGLDVQPRPLPDIIKRANGWSLRWDLFLQLCTETAKIAYYWGRGWI